MDAADTALREACAFGVIPVVEIDGLDDADALAEALLDAGLGVIEVTFRTRVAAEVIARIAGRYPDMLVGAGTVITPHDLERAADAGARFALAPGLSHAMLLEAEARGLPYVPGVMTPSELQNGLERGIRHFKFFPAMPAGGLPLLRAIAAPFGLRAPRFIPTGGIAEHNLAEWLREPAVSAVGGTWIAAPRAIRDRDWDGIRRTAAAAVRIARDIRDASEAA
ncbi:MAG: bifunctional 4-hydroxy-2-oxoglutarate aldolase/2-dehydro-3-deoxy-phosphogluconate aldolase [Gluconacetobacter diazotrophicus]|nr:bifunctional 4-hydroxy-2-oxoglutarate aldolase/2-dehydro-3-deoxy-phosphogluconate aldolase [Gluconacetobacter diazotrophicus]